MCSVPSKWCNKRYMAAYVDVAVLVDVVTQVEVAPHFMWCKATRVTARVLERRGGTDMASANPVCGPNWRWAPNQLYRIIVDFKVPT